MPAAKPESKIEKAIAYITKHPGARSPDIEAACGIKSATALLSDVVDAGYLVTCKVERPGKPPMNEYRLSATVAANKVSWAEFRISRRTRERPTRAVSRPPRNAAPPVVAPRKTETPLPVEAPTPARGTPMKAVRLDDGRIGRVPDTSKLMPIEATPRVVFMVDSVGRLRIEIPDHPAIVCSRDETRDAGTLLIATEPVWA